MNQFKYLGSLITNDGTMTREISERIAKAGGVFARMRRNVFAVKAISKSVKLRVYAASVLAVLLYGSETWNCTAADIKRMESFHNRCLRCMFGISRLTHFTNFDLRKLTGQQTIQSMMMTNRLRWLGHVMRMSDERMPKRMMFGKLQTARPAGGTKQRWKDCVQQDLRLMGLENEWSAVAQHRDKWHAATEGGVKKWEKEKNAKEKEEYEQKKAGIGVKCTFRGCGFIAKNEKGLKSHWSQKHKFVEESSDEDGDDEADDEDDSTDGDDEADAENDSTDGDDEADDENDDSTTTAAPQSSSSSITTPPPTKTTVSGRHICDHCGKDCTNGSGLSSHLRHSRACKAATDRTQ